jgi:hypothetical protein
MESIIATDFSKVTLSSKFLTLKSNNCDIEVDIKKLLQEPINSDSAYFNATPIAKCYDTKVINWLRLDGTQKYIDALERQFQGADSTPLKMVKTIRGKHHSGTWLHQKLILKFIAWLDIDFEIAMYDCIEKLITHTNELKIERQNTTIHFKDLTEAIRDIYIPAQYSENAKKFAYNNLATLINLKVLGCTATKYCSDNNIEIEKDKSIRDYLSKDKVEVLDQTEKKLWALIFGAEITDYDVLKNKLGL